MIGLTHKQRQLLDFLTARIEQTGVAPSFSEMGAHLGLRSKAGIHRLLKALEERRAIRRIPHRSRAIALVEDRTDVIAGRSVLIGQSAYDQALVSSSKAGVSVHRYIADCIEFAELQGMARR